MIVSNTISNDDIYIDIYYDKSNKETNTFTTLDDYCKWIKDIKGNHHIKKIVSSIERCKNQVLEFSDIYEGDTYIDLNSYNKYRKDLNNSKMECQYGLDFYVAFEDNVQPKHYIILLRVKKRYLDEYENINRKDSIVITIQEVIDTDNIIDIFTTPASINIHDNIEHNIFCSDDSFMKKICINKIEDFTKYILSISNITVDLYKYIYVSE